ncbi:MAG: hypothetical protein AAFO04_01015 [Cyanobacteria bacterium J06592_8]
MINSTIFVRLIVQVTLMILTINSGKVWGEVPNKKFYSNQPQPPIVNDGGSRFAELNYNYYLQSQEP